MRSSYSFTNVGGSGGGVGTFKDILGSTVEMKSIAPADDSVVITDTGNQIQIKVNPSAISSIDGGTF